MPFLKFRSAKGSSCQDFRRSAACVEPLERRALLSASLTSALQLGALEGRRNSYSSVNLLTRPIEFRSFKLEAPATFTAMLDGLKAHASLELIQDTNNNGRLDAGEILATSTQAGTAPQTIVRSLAAGSYFIGVVAGSAAGTSYHLALTSDYAGNTPNAARNIGTLASSATYHDFVGPADPTDYYRVTISSTRTISATISHLSASAGIQIAQDKNADGVIQPGEVIASAAGSFSATITKSLAAGTYYIGVLSRGVPTNYQLSLAGVSGHGTSGLQIVFDYRYDTSGFFAKHPDAKAELQQAASAFSRFTDQLTAITPGAGNTWSETFIDPATGKQDTVANPCVAANTLVIYVGASSTLHSMELGEGAPGGWSATGSPTWLDTVEARGQTHALDAKPTDFGPWGGSISFSAVTNWSFSSNLPQAGQFDFLSVAEHEIAHVLGFGTAPSWFTYVSGHDFVGPHVQKLAGDAVPLFDSNDHWAMDTFSTADGKPQIAIMVPELPTGVRRAVTALDFAALQDVGW